MFVKVLDAVCQCRMCETGQGSGFGVDMKMHCPERRARPMGLDAKCKDGCSARVAAGTDEPPTCNYEHSEISECC